jgi:hypothetical protein
VRGVEASGDPHASASDSPRPLTFRPARSCLSLSFQCLSFRDESTREALRGCAGYAWGHIALSGSARRQVGPPPGIALNTKTNLRSTLESTKMLKNEPENEPERTRASGKANRPSPSESMERLRLLRRLNAKRTRKRTRRAHRRKLAVRRIQSY